MKYSNLFPKTSRSAPAGTELESVQWLYRAGFIDQLQAGVFSLLPLGWRVYEKIEQIIREEMNGVGGQEVLMPSLQPKDLWQETGRWESLKGAMYQLKDKGDKEVGLAFTHEEVALDLIRKHTSSYRDYPIKIYHFSTKLRDEPRSRGGLIRLREFTMKDLYSAHTSKADLDQYYEVVKGAYLKIFDRLGLQAKVVEASGGVFTKEPSHEFQVLTESGEDTIFFCQKCDFAQNKEVASVTEGEKCPECGGLISVSRGIEVGNIFKFNQVYSKQMGVKFTGQDGKEDFTYLASYGIGLERAIGTLAEVYHDEQGLIWPASVAPFLVHIVSLNPDNLKVKETADKLELELAKNRVEVLYDDREESTGVKLSDYEAIGVPWRVIVSPKSLAAGGVELKRRDSDEVKIVKISEVLKKVS